MERVSFKLNQDIVRFTGITNLTDIDTVVEHIDADFVVNAINRALRDRALRNHQAGVPIDDLGVIDNVESLNDEEKMKVYLKLITMFAEINRISPIRAYEILKNTGTIK